MKVGFVGWRGMVGSVLMERMLAENDARVVQRDGDGFVRFSADCVNVNALRDVLDSLPAEFEKDVKVSREPLLRLYESVFQHKAFTGRSGTMFGFVGLGSIYWHMVAKLLLAVQEIFFSAVDSGTDKAIVQSLGEYYYRIRKGIGFNKTPAEYGAFPTDPYSHTPKHAGARQPGMTGQVKEEVLTRFAELGVRVIAGKLHFTPALLRRREFMNEPGEFEHLDIDGDWKTIAVPAGGLAFTYCQIPVVYRLDDKGSAGIVVHKADGGEQQHDGLVLSDADSNAIFGRDGAIRRLTVTFDPHALFSDN